MEWIEITVNTVHDELECLTDRLTDLGVTGLITEDEQEIEEFLRDNKKYWDYVDDDFMASVRGVCRVKFYLENSPEGLKELETIAASMTGTELITRRVKDEDWENNWKQYYRPIPVGERLMIVPQWLTAPQEEGRDIILRLDPGLIFGTGAHATTRMCLSALEEYSAPGKNVLDLGCGSGILAIASLLYGCENAIGCDIDEKAPPVVMENAALNGIGPDRLTCFAGDVLSDRSVDRYIGGKKFCIVTANIVADIIIAIAGKARQYLADGGVFICSGIIEGREDQVEEALINAGFTIREHKREDNWNAYVCFGG